jgi:hypothetical protein
MLVADCPARGLLSDPRLLWRPRAVNGGEDGMGDSFGFSVSAIWSRTFLKAWADQRAVGSCASPCCWYPGGHNMNWYVGWGLILSAFLVGAILGLFFYREDFLGGYASFQRRILRLGHIALAALGMINILYSLSPMASGSSLQTRVASVGFMIGGATMPAVCFLTSWRVSFRHLFFVPVSALIIAVIQTLRSGPP